MTTNNGIPRVALYRRVSTDEQARSGFSLDDQLRELRIWVAREGVKVVTEVEDDGYSGASPDRPGLNRVMELAERGEIDAVVAAKRDRFFRSRLHRLLFDRDMQDFGVEVISLNDTGNLMADTFLDSYAEYQRQEIAERTRAGKLQAARQGRIVASSAAPRFGFKYSKDKTAYEIDEPHMAIVHGVFNSIADGQSLYSVVEDLNRRGVPSPRAGANGTSGLWTTAVIRGMINNPAYEPHSHAEVAALVSPEVADKLDKNESYGLWYYAGVPVPIPDSSIPRRTVWAARENLKNNVRASNMGYREWPLSGGILKCQRCGRPMIPNFTTQRGKRYNYYRCSYAYRGHPRCENKRLMPAEETEEVVWAFVSDMVRDPDSLLYQWNTALDWQIADLSDDPEKRRRTIAARIVELDEKKKRAQDLAVDGLIDADDLRGRLKQIASERAAASKELEDVEKTAQRIAEIEASRDAFPELLRTSRERLLRVTPEDQRMTYEDLNLTMWADDGVIVNTTGSFELIGYPTEEELMQYEREALARLEGEEQDGFSTDESRSNGFCTDRRSMVLL